MEEYFQTFNTNNTAAFFQKTVDMSQDQMSESACDKLFDPSFGQVEVVFEEKNFVDARKYCEENNSSLSRFLFV